ncbi:MAG TPA: hypothetical protein VGE45_00355 [Chloroflexia bacterium]|jgi:Holliday junction resolvase RusA-like endonuclease
MAHIVIHGTPVVVIDFPRLPSVNDMIKVAANTHARNRFEQNWRNEGKMVALNWVNKHNYVFAHALIVVRVTRENKIRRDIHNLYCKPILDGFTDAGLWLDDNEQTIPQVLLIYDGVGEPRVSFEIYELDA